MKYCIQHPESEALFAGYHAKFNRWNEGETGWKVLDKSPMWTYEFPSAHLFEDKRWAENECRVMNLPLSSAITINHAKKLWMARK